MICDTHAHTYTHTQTVRRSLTNCPFKWRDLIMANQSISHCGMALSACLWVIKRAWVGIHLIQRRLALKREVALLHISTVCLPVFACKASASTLSSAATAARVKLVRWSHCLEPRGGKQRRRSCSYAKSYVTASKPPIVMECKTHIQTQLHTQQHCFVFSLLCFSITLSFLIDRNSTTL